ncbi:MAG TPA: hypothetical protein VK797_29415 [Tepidisphaeraceae bacterium]|jgi:hypothetical protein|nr:hypothetical protein [Tepidisphaeraceae bacterium]
MANLWETTGNLVFLRANDLGTGYGPPTDFLDVEAVFIQNSLSGGARGFQMRNDQYLPARQAMFSLLRDAFVHNLPVTADYEIDTGKQNGIAIRIALVRSQANSTPVAAQPVAGSQAASAASKTTAAAAKATTAGGKARKASK